MNLSYHLGTKLTPKKIHMRKKIILEKRESKEEKRGNKTIFPKIC